MPGNTWITSPVLLPSAATELGTLLLDIENPAHSHTPGPAAVATVADLHLHLSTLCALSHARTKSARFNDFRANLAASAFGAAARDVLCKTYTLAHPGAFLARLCAADPGARRWLEDHAARRVYFVAGVKTLADVSQCEEFTTLRAVAEAERRAVDLARPASQDMPGAFPCAMWEVGAGVARAAPGYVPRALGVRAEQVYAVQFRRVEIAVAMSSVDVGDGGGVRWMLDQPPGAGVMDVMDVRLGADAGERDVKEHCERIAVSGWETVLYLGPRYWL